MKIRDIIKEGQARSDAPIVGNKNATISRTSKQATKQFKDAEKGHDQRDNARKLLKKVRDMYGMEIVDDFVDALELPNAEHDTDKAESLLSTDQRKK